MGRQVRKVKADWQHPKEDGRYKPLHESYTESKIQFEAAYKENGLQAALDDYGCAPNENDYMPEWSKEEACYYMMYEDISEGTPISPAFATPEELAKWLYDTKASTFANDTGTYEQWLRVCNGGFSPSAFIVNGKIKSGVEWNEQIND